MPTRSQEEIRHDIHRLKDLIDEGATTHAELEAIQDTVDATVTDIDAKAQAFQDTSLRSTTEIAEREQSEHELLKWARSWRYVVAIKVPGADANIREIPTDGATLDHVVNQASDIKKIVETNAAAAPFREKALAQLGTKIEDAKREKKEATAAVSAKDDAEDALGDAMLTANTMLVHATRIVRNVYGAKSTQYKSLLSRDATRSSTDAKQSGDQGSNATDTHVTGTDTSDDDATT